MRFPPTIAKLEAGLRLAFAGHGVAVRRQDEAPIPGEPFIGIEDAIETGARAIRELLDTRS